MAGRETIHGRRAGHASVGLSLFVHLGRGGTRRVFSRRGSLGVGYEARRVLSLQGRRRGGQTGNVIRKPRCRAGPQNHRDQNSASAGGIGTRAGTSRGAGRRGADVPTARKGNPLRAASSKRFKRGARGEKKKDALAPGRKMPSTSPSGEKTQDPSARPNLAVTRRLMNRARFSCPLARPRGPGSVVHRSVRGVATGWLLRGITAAGLLAEERGAMARGQHRLPPRPSAGRTYSPFAGPTTGSGGPGQAGVRRDRVGLPPPTGDINGESFFSPGGTAGGPPRFREGILGGRRAQNRRRGHGPTKAGCRSSGRPALVEPFQRAYRRLWTTNTFHGRSRFARATSTAVELRASGMKSPGRPRPGRRGSLRRSKRGPGGGPTNNGWARRAVAPGTIPENKGGRDPAGHRHGGDAPTQSGTTRPTRPAFFRFFRLRRPREDELCGFPELALVNRPPRFQSSPRLWARQGAEVAPGS